MGLLLERIKPFLLDFPIKLTYFALLFSIGMLVAYQVTLIMAAGSPAPFLESDNYVYLLFSNLSVHTGSLNVSNPYLVYPVRGFFEHPALYQLPVFLHDVLPFISLIWCFRILYLLAILIVYMIPILIARKVLQNTPLNKAYHYLTYTLIVLSYTLMQQTQIIEWRGGAFIVGIQVLMLWVLANAYGSSNKSLWKRLPSYLAVIALLALAWYIWSGWEIDLVALSLLVFIFEIYSKIREEWKRPMFKLLIVILFAFSLVVLFGSQFIDPFIVDLVSRFGITGCQGNVLQLAEVQCLTVTSGLYGVALDTFFSCFIILVFLYDNVFSAFRARYEYHLVGVIALLVLQIPLAMVYLRLEQLIAPYLTICFALGSAGLFARASRAGSNRLILCLVLSAILLANGFAMLVYGNTIMLLYRLDNAPGLVQAASYLSQYPNSTTFAFYNFGTFLEFYGHQKVYGDTIQELNSERLLYFDSIFDETPIQGCAKILNITPIPQFVLLTITMTNYTLYTNASVHSLVWDPEAFGDACPDYTLAWQDQGWYIFRKR